MENRRILIITSEFPPGPGGIGNQAWCLANSLVVMGFEVTVVTDQHEAMRGESSAFDQRLPFKVKRIERRFPFFYITRFISSYRLIRQINPLIILASGKFSLWICGFLKTFLRHHISIVAILHGSEVRPSNRVIRNLTYQSIKKLDKLIFVSNFTKNLLPGSFLSKRNFKVIPNGVNISEYSNLPIQSSVLKGSPKLLTIGNVTRRKGQHRVINSLPQLIRSFPDLHYHCIGIPTKQAEFQLLAKQLNVIEQLTFHGRVKSRSEMLGLAKNADVFIMLSENQKDGDVEGYGIAILEANALGLPVIGAYGSGIEDAIDHGNNGLLVSGDDPEEILEALTRIMDNKMAFSLRAKTWALDHSWGDIAAKYRSFILGNS